MRLMLIRIDVFAGSGVEGLFFWQVFLEVESAVENA